ncbi:sugar phosphate isomerase/epimerase [Streptomyces sp. 7G]|uniref:sugar phosphate isomerase/epimerase family protein n=1 Tax=Streptomyces sp. 7G TaxID=2877241 RepID=UPI001CD2C972|nr:sugar phosphate isomerase/epimerase family protein [Streptomyces sp. 7G]MCA1274665.1 sugar phosphate isomerase/epimerase [Streptomyces sp. 7G]
MNALPWPLAYTVSADDCRTPVPLGFAAPLAEAVHSLAELGYDGVEVQVREPGPGDAEMLERTVGAAGVGVVGIGTGPVGAQDRLTLTDPSPDVRRHSLDRLTDAARLAGELGVPVTLGQTRGTFLPGLADLQLGWARDAVARLADVASAHGSRLLLEPQTRANTSLWNTPDQAVDLIASLTAPVGLVLDTHHLEAEEVDVLDAVARHAHVTGCLQLAASGTRGPLVLGDPLLPALLNSLHEGGFTGWLTLEHTQDHNSPLAAARSWTALTDAAAAYGGV